MNIKKNTLRIGMGGMLAVCSLMPFSSCEKISLEDEEIGSEPSTGNALLTISTRGVDDTEEAIKYGRIYIFNSAGTCVQMLSTTEDNNTATTRLDAGTYTLYAVGVEDLERFNLPTQAEATSTSVITLLSGKVMDDLLMKTVNVTLEDGETLNQPISLEHKVLSIDQVEIKDVPDDVTQVEVSVNSFYSSVRLDGTFPDTPTESYTVTLTKQTDGTTWKAIPQQLLFPTKGAPTITVSVTSPRGVQGFSYTTSDALPANHHFTLSATYKATQGTLLDMVLTASDWGENRIVSFDLDDDNKVIPVAQSYFNGYYVVSVDATAHSAVLLAKSSLAYAAPSSTTDAEAWQTATVAPMAALAKPFGVSTNWRLPTHDEIEVVSKDTQIVTFTSGGISAIYFCTISNDFGWGYTQKSGDTYTFNTGTAEFGSQIKLRPVIDINY